MSKRIPSLVVTLTLDHGYATPMEWRTRLVNACLPVHGKPSNAALAAFVKVWEESTQPGGVNAVVGNMKKTKRVPLATQLGISLDESTADFTAAFRGESLLSIATRRGGSPAAFEYARELLLAVGRRKQT
jgi:hypothetical protein